MHITTQGALPHIPPRVKGHSTHLTPCRSCAGTACYRHSKSHLPCSLTFPVLPPHNSYSVFKTYFKDEIHKKETNINQYYINATWRNILDTILSRIWKKILEYLLAKDFLKEGNLKTLTMISWEVHPPSCFIPHHTNLRRLKFFFLHGKADENY